MQDEETTRVLKNLLGKRYQELLRLRAILSSGLCDGTKVQRAQETIEDMVVSDSWGRREHAAQVEGLTAYPAVEGAVPKEFEDELIDAPDPSANQSCPHIDLPLPRFEPEVLSSLEWEKVRECHGKGIPIRIVVDAQQPDPAVPDPHDQERPDED